MTAWPLVPLGEVITHRKEFISIDDSLKYKRCRVQLHAQGIVLRDEVPGIEIKTKAQQVCREGEFLVAEIDAKVGGFGIVPPGLEGAIVSSHYFLFSVDSSVLDVRFLGYYIKTAAFGDQVLAQGSTNYAAIRPSHVLAYTMPLPPIEEQRRIVKRIEELSNRLSGVAKLRKQAQEEARTFLPSALHKIFVSDETSWPGSDVGTVADIIDPNPSHRMPQYAESGIPFISTVDFEGSEGIRKRTVKYVTEQTYSEQVSRCSFSIGDIVYSRIGTIGEARLLTEIWPFALSHVLVVVKPKSQLVLPRFLLWYLRSDSIVTQASIATRSIGVPDLGIKHIRRFHIPLPGLHEQSQIVARLDGLQSSIDSVRSLQSAADSEIRSVTLSILNHALSGQL
jgi:type I restriction enzyme S subunit